MTYTSKQSIPDDNFTDKVGNIVFSRKSDPVSLSPFATLCAGVRGSCRSERSDARSRSPGPSRVTLAAPVIGLARAGLGTARSSLRVRAGGNGDTDPSARQQSIQNHPILQRLTGMTFFLQKSFRTTACTLLRLDDLPPSLTPFFCR